MNEDKALMAGTDPPREMVLHANIGRAVVNQLTEYGAYPDRGHLPKCPVCHAAEIAFLDGSASIDHDENCPVQEVLDE